MRLQALKLGIGLGSKTLVRGGLSRSVLQSIEQRRAPIRKEYLVITLYSYPELWGVADNNGMA